MNVRKPRIVIGKALNTPCPKLMAEFLYDYLSRNPDYGKRLAELSESIGENESLIHEKLKEEGYGRDMLSGYVTFMRSAQLPK
jgi:hypothetical protein